ncbi:hypothetical protein MLD38_003293 [Melastoma candidum]|uniref:Uncharacterized protein n=1 Tax=Melastoma candidum TaxID=119954 RepID=A0ACB9S1V2_9MYRT|nr:hypothetical protein MLD38_003293 [Melastoma candidum]
MGRSLRSKAVNLVTDLTTVILNPLSDKPASSSSPGDNYENNSKGSPLESIKEYSGNPVDEPDTSSFTAFLYSLLSSSDAKGNSKVEGHHDEHPPEAETSPDTTVKEASTASRKDGNSNHKRSILSRGRQSLGRAFHHAAKIVGYKSTERKSDDSNVKNGDGDVALDDDTGVETSNAESFSEAVIPHGVPQTSEPSLLLSDKTQSALYASLPAVVQGRKWLLLYSTWRHGISLSTLYRRSFLWPGLSLLVVGDRKDVVFGGLVEAPLRPTNKKKYQGTNNTFVFTNISGHPAIFRPTGANRYYTLCSTEHLAIGGGGHFALYLDGDLLSGSSSESETYGNPCLSHSENFEVKEVELWGFVYASKYDEILSQSRTEAPGICRW